MKCPPGRAGKRLMAYLPNRGDIVHLELDPSTGQEMKGPHFGLVLSRKVFNQ